MAFDFTEKPQLTLLSDAPLNEEDCADECFGLGVRLGPIYHAIRHKDMHTPFSVMISGGWGTGKTSAMTWLQLQLANWASYEDKGDGLLVYTCWFHPWKYQTKEDVWRGLIAEVMLKRLESEERDPAKIIEVAAEFGHYFGSAFLRPVFGMLRKFGIETYGWEEEVPINPADNVSDDPIIARLKRILKFSKAVTVAAGKVKIQTGGKEVELDPLQLGTIAETYLKSFKPHEPFLNAFEELLRKELQDWLGRTRRLCIFIDDLDRCMPDVAVQVLEALKLYLHLPNVIFVVGVDRSVLDKVILKRHLDMVSSEDNVAEFRDKARAYADKMFQVEVNVEPSEVQTNAFFQRLSRRDQATRSFWDDLGEHQEVFEKYLKGVAGKNPRTMVRTMNTMLLSAQRLRADDYKLTGAQSLQQVLLRETALKILHGDVIKDEACEIFLEGASRIIREFGVSAVPLTNADFSENSQTEAGEAGGAIASLANYAKAFPQYRHLLTNWDIVQLLRVEYQRLTDAQRSALIEVEASAGLAVSGAASAVVENRIAAEHLETLRMLVGRSQRRPPGQVGDEELRQLEVLDLSSDPEVTDEILPALSEMPSLRRLYLNGTNITNENFGLRRMAKLETLNLQRTNITDIGIAALKTLHSLQYLNLSETLITDKALAHLRSLTALKGLDVWGTAITFKAVEELSAGMPACRVRR